MSSDDITREMIDAALQHVKMEATSDGGITIFYEYEDEDGRHAGEGEHVGPSWDDPVSIMKEILEWAVGMCGNECSVLKIEARGDGERMVLDTKIVMDLAGRVYRNQLEKEDAAKKERAERREYERLKARYGKS